MIQLSKTKLFKQKLYHYKPTSKSFRKKGENTHGEGRHKAHKKGERISYATPRGRTTGKICEVHKEYYIVKTKGKLHKVNRNSILYKMGTYEGNTRTVPIKTFTTNAMPIPIREPSYEVQKPKLQTQVPQSQLAKFNYASNTKRFYYPPWSPPHAVRGKATIN